MTARTCGITAFGAYIPRLRLDRAAMVAANSWMDPGLRAHGKGRRSMCDWDEDAVTMAVEAARDCLTGQPRGQLSALYLASTTLPFADRQNSAIVAEALALPETVSAVDIAHSQRAGTSALRLALGSPPADGLSALVVASDHRRTKPGSTLEMLYGDAAAAVSIGCEGVVARFLGSMSTTRDFVDHFRQPGGVDYEWEERWIREEGYLKLVPPVIGEALQRAGLKAAEVDHFVLPCVYSRVREAVAKQVGIRPEAIRENLAGQCGESGAAHALVMMVAALEQASPGQRILVVGFGQGVDALVFETTPALSELPSRRGVAGHLARATIEKNYGKFQSFNHLIEMHWGSRSEVDRKTAISTAYRHREFASMTGGRCTRCGTVQFPQANLCVNPECGAEHTQESYCLADEPASIASVTSDWLAISRHPPQRYGMVRFANGAKLLMQLTSDGDREPEVGMPLRLQFRIKDVDDLRHYQRYFWKAALDL